MAAHRPRGRPAPAAAPSGVPAFSLVDLVLASQAAAFVAVDVRAPFRSAFVEWIVQARHLRGKGARTELVSLWKRLDEARPRIRGA